MESHDIDYDALVGTIGVEDITSDEDHQYYLRMIKDDAPDFTHLSLSDQTDEFGYCPGNILELGWLGYFIGHNTHLESLEMEGFPLMNSTGAMEVFCRGAKRNESIEELDFVGLSQIQTKNIIGAMGPTLGTNSITQLRFLGCNLGAEECRQLSYHIGGRKRNKLLKSFRVQNCAIDGRHFIDVVSALSLHPQLKSLEFELDERHLIDILSALRGHPQLESLDLMGLDDATLGGRNCCLALEGLLRSTTIELQTLSLYQTGFDDESVTILARGLSQSKSMRDLSLCGTNMRDSGVGALVSALKNSKVEELNLSTNNLITTSGWKSISTLLQCPSSNLKKLYLNNNAIGDVEAMYFASALARNSTLVGLYIYSGRFDPTITAIGLNAFAPLLCDTSDVDATYHSNHTLSFIGYDRGISEFQGVETSLDLNGSRYSEQQVATIKILRSHPDISMQPMMKWDLKVLPLVLAWFERAATCPTIVEADIDKRRFSALYECVRGAPMVAIEGLLWHDLFTIGDEKRKLLVWGSGGVTDTFVSQLQELEQRASRAVKRLGLPVGLDSFDAREYYSRLLAQNI